MEMEKIIGLVNEPQYAASLVSLLLVFIGYNITRNIKKDSPLKPYLLQILGLTFILPVVLLASIILKLNSEAVTGLLGTIVGYIFGTFRNTDKNDIHLHREDLLKIRSEHKPQKIIENTDIEKRTGEIYKEDKNMSKTTEEQNNGVALSGEEEKS